MSRLGSLGLSTLNFLGFLFISCFLCILHLYFCLTRKWLMLLFAPLHDFTFSILLADLLSVSIWSVWLLVLPSGDLQVCEFLYMDSRLKLSYFLLLQNPQVSVHYYFCLNIGRVFLSILSKFVLSWLWHLNPQQYFNIIRGTYVICFFHFLVKVFLVYFILFLCRSMHIYKT